MDWGIFWLSLGIALVSGAPYIPLALLSAHIVNRVLDWRDNRRRGHETQ